MDVTSGQARRVAPDTSQRSSFQRRMTRPNQLGLQVHVQADGGASGTGADLDQIADLLDDPEPAAAPGRDWIPF